jgi:hypothetical protein
VAHLPCLGLRASVIGDKRAVASIFRDIYNLKEEISGALFKRLISRVIGAIMITSGESSSIVAPANGIILYLGIAVDQRIINGAVIGHFVVVGVWFSNLVMVRAPQE